MKKRPNKIYTRLKGGVIRKVPIEYSQEIKEEILRNFPSERREEAYKMICKNVSVFIGVLKEGYSLRTKKINSEIEEIRDHLRKILPEIEALIPKLEVLSKDVCRPSSVKIRKILYDAINLRSGEELIRQIPHDLNILKGATIKALEIEDTKGTQHSHYYDVVRNLADIWEELTGKKATLHNKHIDGIQQTSGPFFNYTSIVLKTALEEHNITNERLSMANIAKKVIADRKKL